MAGFVGIHVEQRVHFRDELGRFLSEVDAAGAASSKQLADAIEQLADAAAWSGSKPVTATAHGWSAVATAFGRLAGIQEFGARPHRIEPGLTHGYLANEGAGFGPVRGGVNHPGVRARHFLSQAGAAVGSMAIGLIARNFPK